MYLWICTTHIQPPHVTYVAWKWWAYILSLFVISYSDIYQDVSPEPKSTQLNEQSLCWLEMYGQPLSLFFSLPFPALLDISLAQEPSIDIVWVGWHFTWKRLAREYLDYVLRKKQRSDKLVLDRLIWHWVNWASFHFHPPVSCVGGF